MSLITRGQVIKQTHIVRKPLL